MPSLKSIRETGKFIDPVSTDKPYINDMLTTLADIGDMYGFGYDWFELLEDILEVAEQLRLGDRPKELAVKPSELTADLHEMTMDEVRNGELRDGHEMTLKSVKNKLIQEIKDRKRRARGSR